MYTFRRAKEAVGRHHQGMDSPGVQQVSEGAEEQEAMDETGCKIIYCAPTTLTVKGLMMMMMMMIHFLSEWGNYSSVPVYVCLLIAGSRWCINMEAVTGRCL